MGVKTLPFLVGFVALHLALILDATSMGSPDWLVGRAAENATSNSSDVTKGLWAMCWNDDCNTLNETLQADSFRATQALFTIGTGSCLVSLVLLYVVVFCTSFKESLPLTIAWLSAMLVSGFSLLTSVIIFGVRAKDDTGDIPTDYDLHFGWGFDVAIAATVMTFIACTASVRLCALQKNEPRGYEDLP